jgi:hypothetical protein
VTFLHACVAKSDERACRTQLERHHGQCFSANFQQCSWLCETALDTRAYARCVDLGPDAWQVERRETMKKELEFKRELLNPS